MTIEYDCRLCGHPWTSEHGKRGEPLSPLNYELLLLRTDILDLIKFACKRARQHNHDKHHSIGIRKWAYEFLHNEAVMYVHELIWLYRQAGEK